jgi:signal transduction histidine kinase
MKILLLDDNPDDRALAARALRQAFDAAQIFEVATQDDLERALAEGGFDIAVTDYHLRWTDGLQVLDRLIHAFPRLPVVMFTNTGNEEVCAEGMKRGLSDYVIKRHGQYHRLAHAVRGVLERHELHGRVEALLAKEREAREEAERAGRVKDEFLATLSHELRTPLHSMLGWVQLLKQGVLKAGDEKHALDVIERNARAQAALIEDLLDLSRLESGRLELSVQEIDIGPVVLNAIASVQPMAQARKVAIHPHIDELLPRVTADAARLRQMVLNLLTNAIKFSQEGGEVRVRVAREEGRAAIEVCDRGAGMSTDFLPHVFDRFRQEDASTRRRSGGMGIGLALVKKLTEAHGGTIEAASPGSGQGATFTLRLPLATALAEAKGPAPDREHPPTLEGVRIVAIDDDTDSLRFLERMLMHCHADVRTASDSEAGLDLVREHRPNVVVCDIGMPRRDGYDFVRELRCLSEEALRTTPAVALTAFARAEDRERALLAGFDTYVAKPVDGYELLVVVAGLAGVLQRAHRCEVAT